MGKALLFRGARLFVIGPGMEKSVGKVRPSYVHGMSDRELLSGEEISPERKLGSALEYDQGKS